MELILSTAKVPFSPHFLGFLHMSAATEVQQSDYFTNYFVL